MGICITHAHEDHIGALATLWPKLKCKVYATRFASGLLEVRRLNEPGAPQIKILPARAGAVIDLDPFQVEYVAVAHSIRKPVLLLFARRLGLSFILGIGRSILSRA